jgi:undecaprenyl-diphosphatase
MAVAIALGTIPAAIAGLLFASWIEANLRDPAIIVYTLAGYGILMALADRYAKREKGIAEVRIKDALIIGVAQSLALIPGTSRSGITITAGRLLGFERQDAARFSFLLSAPVISVSQHRVLYALCYPHWIGAFCGLSHSAGSPDSLPAGVNFLHSTSGFAGQL